MYTDEQKSFCVFTGHRQMTQEEMTAASAEILSLLSSLREAGIHNFFTGGAMGFDTVASVTVLNAKITYPELRLHLVFPCRDYDRYWDKKSAAVMRRVIERADEVIYLHKEYVRGCMQERNRFMVDRSCRCIAWLKKSSGGTCQTVHYAEKSGIPVLNLASEGAEQKQISMFGDQL